MANLGEVPRNARACAVRSDTADLLPRAKMVRPSEDARERMDEETTQSVTRNPYASVDA
jgi:hypothetical protein